MWLLEALTFVGWFQTPTYFSNYSPYLEWHHLKPTLLLLRSKYFGEKRFINSYGHLLPDFPNKVGRYGFEQVGLRKMQSVSRGTRYLGVCMDEHLQSADPELHHFCSRHSKGHSTPWVSLPTSFLRLSYAREEEVSQTQAQQTDSDRYAFRKSFLLLL